MHERLTITYYGESISKIQIFDPELISTKNLKYKEDSVFILGNDQFRGEINDTLIINSSADILNKLLTNNTITYNYDNRGNVISTSNQSDALTYDTNPSSYSTIGIPNWFLNYLYETSDFMDNYAGANNILTSSYNGSVNEQYSYEYDADRYPVKMSITDEYETISYKLTY